MLVICVAEIFADKWDRVLNYILADLDVDWDADGDGGWDSDWARSTEWSRMVWTAVWSAGTGVVQATVTREKGFGMRKRSQERSRQARSGWT